MTFDPFHSSNAVNTIFMSASAVQIYAPFGHRLSDIQKAVKLFGSYYGLIRNALSNMELHPLVEQLRFVINF